jgi:hypothetical protein
MLPEAVLPRRRAAARAWQHKEGDMRKYWKTALDGSFGTSSNWSPAGVPGNGDLVFITPTAIFPYTVTVSASSTVLGLSLGTNATLDITNSSVFTASEGTGTGKNLGIIQVETG